MKIRVFLGGSDFLRIGTARRKEKVPSPTHAEVRSRSGPKKPFGSGAARSRDDRGAVKVFLREELRRRIAGDSISPQFSAGEIPGFPLPGEPEFLASFRD